MESHCHFYQGLNEDVVVQPSAAITTGTTASDTAEAVATTVGAALVAAIILSVAACLLDVLTPSPCEFTVIPQAEWNVRFGVSTSELRLIVR